MMKSYLASAVLLAACAAEPICLVDVSGAGLGLTDELNALLDAKKECGESPSGTNCSLALLSAQKKMAPPLLALNEAMHSCANNSGRCLSDLAAAQTAAFSSLAHTDDATVPCRKSEDLECGIEIAAALADASASATALITASATCVAVDTAVTGSLACKADIAVGTADLAALSAELKKTLSACAGNDTSSCAADIAAVGNDLDNIAAVLQKATTDCTGLSAACDADLSGAATAIEAAVSAAKDAETQCVNGSETACISDIVTMLSSSTKATLDLVEASKNCKSN